jgi:hypothetical protein
MLNYMRSPGYKPEGLMQFGAPGINAYKGITEAGFKAKESEKVGVETTGKKQDIAGQAMRNMASDPSDDNVRRSVQNMVDQGIMTPAQGAESVDKLLSMTPAQRVVHWSTQGLPAKDLHEITTSKPLKMSDGQREWYIEGNMSLPTAGQVLQNIPGVQLKMNPFQTAEIPIKQQEANARTSQANTAAAGLPLRAVQVDPLGITGAQDAYPLPTLPNTAAGKTASIDPRANFTPQQIAAIQADAAKNAAPAGAAAPTLGGQLTLKQAAQQGLKGNDLLGAMPSLQAGQVAAIVDHRAAPPIRNTARGDQLMQLVQAVDPTYDATAYGTKAGIEKAFASGRAGDTVRTFGVVQNHLDTLTEAGKALANNDVQAFNKVGNTIAQWTGQPAPTDFQAVKRIVAGEITKAVIGAAGALGDRNAVDEALNSANSPAQLAGVVNRYKQLISGQVEGFRKQYEAGGGAHADKIFGTTAAAAPNIDALLNKYK